jgi:L-ascorbate metabolism protein UlaG (beta-lactamase superfamily)
MSLTFTWLAHSTFLFEADGNALIIDPFITNNPLLDISVNDIRVDTIILTHAHGDHVGVTDKSPAGDTITIAKRNNAAVFCNYEMGNWFAKNGVPGHLISQGNPGGTVRGNWVDVKFTKAFHSSSFEDGSYGGVACGVILRTGGYTVYHAGDTELFGDMALIGEENIDLAILPIGDSFTMGVDDSIKAVKLLKPKYVAPCHYNTFPPIVQDVAAWADRMNRETSAQPIVIDPKQSYTIE